ncbi:hypothetical protein BFR41_05195 [Brochothrix thermosphacta]|nr:hypothetical protein BFR41_05195 [Brochothrix thermosphacta]ODJ71290.1 hypothetical protein BFR43_05385 [Brochothrix thermosphacta]
MKECLIMTIQLPDSVRNYFQASNTYESDILLDCFVKDAIFDDIGTIYTGRVAIKNHLVQENNDLNTHTSILKGVKVKDDYLVTAKVSGDFAGSPINFNFLFTTKNEKISKIKISLVD